MADVFISFIHEQQRVAEEVQKLLRSKLEKEVFMSADTWQVLAGEDWLARIRKELRSSHVVVLMLSPESVARPWINFEAGAAWLARKIIIPVCFGGLKLDALPKPYATFQAVELPDGASYLVQSIAHHVNVLVPPPLDEKDTQELRGALGGRAV